MMNGSASWDVEQSELDYLLTDSGRNDVNSSNEYILNENTTDFMGNDTGLGTQNNNGLDEDSIYFIVPHPDPALAVCTNIVLKSDLKVRI